MPVGSAEWFVLCKTFSPSNFSVKLIRIVVRTKLRLPGTLKLVSIYIRVGKGIRIDPVSKVKFRLKLRLKS